MVKPKNSWVKSVRRVGCVLSLFFIINLAAQAGVTLPIYEDVQSVQDKSSTTRLISMRDALERVLVRVSGNPKIMANVAIEKLAQQPEQYLQAYEYQSRTDATTKTVQWKCRYVFETRKINQLLTSHGQTVWSAYRPNVLVWWALAQDPQAQPSEIISNDNQSPYVGFWKQQAQLRGMATMFPMADIATQSALDVQDIWQMNEEKLKQASSNYRTDAQVVITLLANKEGIWQGSLQLLNHSTQPAWKTSHKEAKVVITQLVDKLAEHFSHKQTARPIVASTKTYTLLINDVHDRKNFQKVTRYLKGLAQVKSVQLLTIEADKVIVNVHYQGDDKAFSNRILLDKMLKLADSDMDASPGAELQLRFVG